MLSFGGREEAPPTSDVIAVAQQRLAVLLAQARAGEDRELAVAVREQGAQVAHLLNGLLRMARTHSLSNTAFDDPVREFGAALYRLQDLLGPVSLQCVERHIYVNDLRLRFDKIVEPSMSLGDDLQRHEVGGITFNEPLSGKEIRSLIRLIFGPAAAERPRVSLRAKLTAEGMRSLQLHPVFRYRISGEEHLEPNLEFADVYRASANAIATVFASVGAGRLPSPLPIRRVIQQLIDASRGKDAAAEALEVEPSVPAFARHTLMVTNLALLLGRSAGLPDGSLADLGVAAAFHDLGFCLRETGPTVAFERHTRAALPVLLRQRGFHRAKLRRILTVVEHHRNATDPSGVPSLYARIIHIADDYDILTRPRTGRTRVLSTPDCLARMAAQSGKAYDPLLLQLFINAMGRFPPGAVLRLADGHVVVSASAVRSPQTFAAPRARVLQRPDGSVPSAVEYLDLVGAAKVVKVHMPAA
ncbi:MAG: HD-GYP domain-containing protein [Thermoanaerobaculales bacterium]